MTARRILVAVILALLTAFFAFDGSDARWLLIAAPPFLAWCRLEWLAERRCIEAEMHARYVDLHRTPATYYRDEVAW